MPGALEGGWALTPKATQERLGHSSITVTLDCYGHLFPSLEESLVGLDKVYRGSAAEFRGVAALTRAIPRFRPYP